MKARISFYIGALVEGASGQRPHDLRVSPIFKSTEEFNRWLQATQRVTVESITLTFHAQNKPVQPNAPGEVSP